MGHSIEITVQGQSESARGPLSEPHEACGSLYVHVPFCFHKCHYCDFYSIVDLPERHEAFADRLIREIEFLADHAGPLATIFIGGGTPTLLAPSTWTRVLDAMAGVLRFGECLEGGVATEFTVECNPETATPELMSVLARGGVNRISIGAQSFNGAHLETLERWHDPENVARALELAGEAGIERRSIDLIFGIPGQSLADWEHDLEIATALPIDHVSCYGLTYEPNTPMTKRLERGEFSPCDEDLEADMYEATLARLGEAGFERYEVSNFARTPGSGPSRHNLVYWQGGSWLAAGPSASAHVAGHRWKNVGRLTEWMAGIERHGGASPIIDHERPDARRALAERFLMGMRLVEGQPEAELLASAEALGRADALVRAMDIETERGLLERRGEMIALTSRGFLLADGVIAALIATLE